jgi:hypothetical protein
MKLDNSVIYAIVDSVLEGIEKSGRPRFVLLRLKKQLKELDLVVKPGDSSQSVLVENKR